jgi:hypothetical protein
MGGGREGLSSITTFMSCEKDEIKRGRNQVGRSTIGAREL